MCLMRFCAEGVFAHCIGPVKASPNWLLDEGRVGRRTSQSQQSDKSHGRLEGNTRQLGQRRGLSQGSQTAHTTISAVVVRSNFTCPASLMF